MGEGGRGRKEGGVGEIWRGNSMGEEAMREGSAEEWTRVAMLPWALIS